MAITHRKITLNDVETLKKLSETTFSQTFGEFNTKENMESFLSEAYTIDKLSAEISNPESEFYFIYYNNDLAGYLKLNVDHAQSEYQDKDSLEVERIYILNDFQKHGLGKEFLNLAFSKALEKNKTKIWLGVWENNQNALGFYKHAGFKQFDQHTFKLGDDPQTDLIMAKSLNND